MRINKNLIANYVGQFWVTAIGVLFVPVYIRYLGLEAYGVVGLYALFLAWVALLDLGLSTALSREVALSTRGGDESSANLRDFLRTIELVLFVTVSLTATLLWLSAKHIGASWLQANALDSSELRSALQVVAFLVALRLVEGVYKAVLVNLEHQVTYNVINITCSTLRATGSWFVLAFVSPTLYAFFLWQLCISLLTALLLIYSAYARLGAAPRAARIRVRTIWSKRAFLGGSIATAFLGLAAATTDRIILSKHLPLAAFGEYTALAVLSTGLATLTAPLIQAWYPKLVQFTRSNDIKDLKNAYHTTAQLLTVTIGTLALSMLFNSERLLTLWFHGKPPTDEATLLFRTLVVSAFLGCLTWPPVHLQMAYGVTRWAVINGAITMLFSLPALLLVIPRYGAQGAVYVNAAIQIWYLAVVCTLMHRSLLRGEQFKWYANDICLPLTGGCIAGFAVEMSLPDLSGVYGGLASVAISTIAIGYFCYRGARLLSTRPINM